MQELSWQDSHERIRVQTIAFADKSAPTSIYVSPVTGALACPLIHSSFFISPASAANGLWVALAVFGVLSEPSAKYCWSV